MSIYWITGASSGIGEALAKALVDQGHELILSARNETKLLEFKASLKHPDSVAILPLDLAQMSHPEDLVERAFAFFGPVEKVILNAGISQRSLAEETEFQVYREIMEVNYFGNVALSRPLLKKFIAQNMGHFVIISSVVGKFGTPFRSGYSASKHALHGHFDSLRAEMMMLKRNIDVSIICPGFVATNISYNALEGSGQKTGVYDQGNAQGMSPQEFAKKALKAIENKEYESYIGGKEVLGVTLKRFFPSLFYKKIAQVKTR